MLYVHKLILIILVMPSVFSLRKENHRSPGTAEYMPTGTMEQAGKVRY